MNDEEVRYYKEVVIIPISYLPAYSPSIILENDTYYIDMWFTFGGKRMKNHIRMIRKELYHKYHKELDIGTLLCFMSGNMDVIEKEVTDEELEQIIKEARVIGVP